MSLQSEIRYIRLCYIHSTQLLFAHGLQENIYKCINPGQTYIQANFYVTQISMLNVLIFVFPLSMQTAKNADMH